MSRDMAAIKSLDTNVQNLLTELQQFESGPHAEGHSGGPPGGGGGMRIEGHSGGPPGGGGMRIEGHSGGPPGGGGGVQTEGHSGPPPVGGGGMRVEGHSGGPPGDELHAAITALKNFQRWLRREIDKA